MNDISIFGVLRSDLDEFVSQQAQQYNFQPDALAISMLSNAQEMINRNDNERARLEINRAKYIISEYCTVK